MARLLLFAILLSIPIVLSACGGESDGKVATVSQLATPTELKPSPTTKAANVADPKEGVQKLYQAILDGDRGQFSSYLSNQMAPAMRNGLLAVFCAWQQASDSAKDEIRIRDLVVRSVQAGQAKVEVDFVASKPDRVDLDEVSLLFEGSEWKVVAISSVENALTLQPNLATPVSC